MLEDVTEVVGSIISLVIAFYLLKGFFSLFFIVVVLVLAVTFIKTAKSTVSKFVTAEGETISHHHQGHSFPDTKENFVHFGTKPMNAGIIDKEMPKFLKQNIPPDDLSFEEWPKVPLRHDYYVQRPNDREYVLNSERNREHILADTPELFPRDQYLNPYNLLPSDEKEMIGGTSNTIQALNFHYNRRNLHEMQYRQNMSELHYKKVKKATPHNMQDNISPLEM